MLKKVFMPLILAGVVVSGNAGNYDVEANPSEVFLGVQLSGAWVQGAHKTDLNYATKGYAYGVRVGAQNCEWRTLISLDKMNNKKVSYERAELHVDYMYKMMPSGEVNIKPFIGLNTGYANYEAEGNIDENGITYGAEAGVVFDVSDNVDVDLSYQYTLSRAKAFDHASNVGLGINYKY